MTIWTNTKRFFKRYRIVLKKKWTIFKIWYDKNYAILVLDFCNQTNIHGFQQMANPAHVNLKIGWIVFCFLCMLLMYLAVGSLIIASYSGSNISTTITHHMPETFPAILFCPQSWLDNKKISSLMPKSNTSTVPYSILNTFILLLSYDNFELVRNNPDTWKAINQPPFNFTDINLSLDKLVQFNNVSSIHQLYSMVSYNCNDLIGKDPFIESSEPFVRTSRVCCRITFSPLAQLQSVRRRSFVYNIPNQAVTSSLESSSILDTPYHTIQIGDDDSNSKLSQNSLEITKGMDFRFSIQVSKHIHYNTKAKPCNLSNKRASLEQCITNCQETYIRQAFGCSFFFGQETDPNSPYCLRQMNVSTPQELVDNMPGNLSDKSTLHTCYQTCHIPCLMTVYDPVILPLGRRQPPTASSEHTAEISFQYENYYASLDYKDSISSSWSWSSMVSNIGGTVSLCSGASFIALAHVVYHFLLRQICPPPNTVHRVSRQLSGSAVSVFKVSHENLSKFKEKLPLWKKSLLAAQEGGRRIATSMEPSVRKTRVQIRKISSLRPAFVPPKIVIQPSFTPDVSPKVSVVGTPPRPYRVPPSPKTSVRSFLNSSVRRKISGILPMVSAPEPPTTSVPLTTLRIPSLEEANHIMKRKSRGRDIEDVERAEVVLNPIPLQKLSRNWDYEAGPTTLVEPQPPVSINVETLHHNCTELVIREYEEGQIKQLNAGDSQEPHRNDGGSNWKPSSSPIIVPQIEIVPTIEIEETCLVLDPRED